MATWWRHCVEVEAWSVSLGGVGGGEGVNNMKYPCMCVRVCTDR